MTSLNQCRFLKDSFQLLKKISHVTNGQACANISASGNSRPSLLVTIQPNDGPYKGAYCAFKIQASSEYPVSPPEVTCLSRVYHPNISYRGGHVCINVLSHDWQSTFGLDGLLSALLFLLNNPNLEEPLPSSPVPCGETWEIFLHKVSTSLRGGLLDRRRYDQLCS